MSKIDIKFELLANKKNEGFENSFLALKIKGKDVFPELVNSFRRIVMCELPKYAYENITITKNTSIFDNDKMTLRLSLLPIFNIKTGDKDVDKFHEELSFLEQKYWKDIDHKDPKQRYPKSLDIDLYITANNNTNKIMNVTTKDALYMVNGQKVSYENPNPDEPILLIQLNENQQFEAHIKAVMGLGEAHDKWSCCHAYYEYEEETDINFTLESFGQFTERTLLLKAMDNIVIKMTNIEKDVKNNSAKGASNNIMEISLIDEDDTISRLINALMQDDERVIFCGVSKPDFLIKTMVIKVVTTDEKNKPVDIFVDAVKKAKNIVEHCKKELLSLSIK